MNTSIGARTEAIASMDNTSSKVLMEGSRRKILKTQSKMHESYPISEASCRSSQQRGVDDDPRCAEVTNMLLLKETGTIRYLRATVLILLLTTATAACGVIFCLACIDEQREFEVSYRANARRIVESFHHAITQRLSANHILATAITSYALTAGQEFPFVTLPHFAEMGSAIRVTADSMVVHWKPLITEENRAAWEEFTLENRFHIDKSFEDDARLRDYQDQVTFPVQEEDGEDRDDNIRFLDEKGGTPTILDDGTGYHPHLWDTGDMPANSGPWCPLWQRRWVYLHSCAWLIDVYCLPSIYLKRAVSSCEQSN